MWYQTDVVLDTIADTIIDTRIWPTYQTNTDLHPTQSPGLLAKKFEKFDLSFMIAFVNLSSNGSSVSCNVCQRLCALPHMHRSIYFPNLSSKPKVMCTTPSHAPVYLLSKSQLQA
jgi:hypothetical protein